jgi:hypothetical protein
MQSRSLFHAQMLFQPSFRKEISGKLYGAAETSSDHSGANTAIKTLDALVAVDLSQPIICIFIFVLRTDRQERRVRLQSRLDEEKGRSSCGA